MNKKILLLIQFDLLESKKTVYSPTKFEEKLNYDYAKSKFYRNFPSKLLSCDDNPRFDLDIPLHLQKLESFGIEIVILSKYEKMETLSKLIFNSMNNLNKYIKYYPPSRLKYFLRPYQPEGIKGITQTFFVTDVWYEIPFASSLGISTIGMLSGNSLASAIKRQNPEYTISSLNEINQILLLNNPKLSDSLSF